MVELLPYAVPLILGIVATATTTLVGKVISTDRKMTAHMAADDVSFGSIEQSFEDLKGGQKATNEKLDRLIEHLLTEPSTRRQRKR